jgi:hypothetical protein
VSTTVAMPNPSKHFPITTSCEVSNIFFQAIKSIFMKWINKTASADAEAVFVFN